MTDLNPIDYKNLLEILILNILIYIFSFIFFKYIWLNNVEFDLKEKPYYTFPQECNYFKKIFILIKDIENSHNFWIQRIGFDGYCYIVFMLEVTYSLLLFLIFKGIFSLILFMIDSIIKIGVIDNPMWLEYSYEITQIIQITILTMLFLLSFYGVRKKLQTIYYYFYIEPNLEKGFNYLKLRTIMVKGVEKMDIGGENLRDLFCDKFYENGIRGSVYGIVMIPSCEKLFKIEIEKSLYKIFTDLIKNSKGKAPFNYFLKPYKDEIVEKELERLNLKEKELLNNNNLDKSSGYAFVCFNSFNTVTNAIKLYK